MSLVKLLFLFFLFISLSVSLCISLPLCLSLPLSSPAIGCLFLSSVTLLFGQTIPHCHTWLTGDRTSSTSFFLRPSRNDISPTVTTRTPWKDIKVHLKVFKSFAVEFSNIAAFLFIVWDCSLKERR